MRRFGNAEKNLRGFGPRVLTEVKIIFWLGKIHAGGKDGKWDTFGALGSPVQKKGTGAGVSPAQGHKGN